MSLKSTSEADRKRFYGRIYSLKERILEFDWRLEKLLPFSTHVINGFKNFVRKYALSL